jgi:dethiobiotin synthetase
MSSHTCHCLAVVGTDTGVGKTVIASALAAVFKQRRFTVAVFKPAESGCSPGPGGLIAADTQMLIDASGCRADRELINPYRFKPPLSPAAAAQLAGETISMERVEQCYRTLRDTHQILIMEGAGGLMVPYGPDWLFAELLVRLSIPVVVVGRSILGTINHCLLTLRELARLDLDVRGVVLNRLQADRGPEEDGNPAAISQFSQAEVLGVFPYLKRSDVEAPEQLAASATAHLDLKPLFPE